MQTRNGNGTFPRLRSILVAVLIAFLLARKVLLLVDQDFAYKAGLTVLG